jgi:hypothetical protein
MTNRIDFINIDGRLNTEYLPFFECYTCFPEKIGHIKSISIASVELPVSFIVDASNECIANPRYVYLEIIGNENHNNRENNHLFASSIFCSRIGKYILARITLDYQNYPCGSILPANISNGLLITGTRKYHKPIHMKGIYFRLLNELGIPIICKDDNISFCFQIECANE